MIYNVKLDLSQVFWLQPALSYAILAVLAIIWVLFFLYSICSKYRFNLLLSGGFAFIISASLIHDVAPIIPQSPVLENRKLAERPEFNRQNLSTYHISFTAWFNDHFGLRTNLVSFYSWIKYVIFNSSPTDSIITAKQGWTFYNADQVKDGKSISNFRHMAGFDSDQQVAIERNLRYFKAYFDDRNIPFCFFVAPDKISMYPELAPDYLTRKPGIDRLDQLVAIARSISGFPIIDMRPALFDAKNRREIYFRHGTHWNEFGALVAFMEVQKCMKPTFPNMRIWKESDFTFKEYPSHFDNMFDGVGLQYIITAPYIKVETLEPVMEANDHLKTLYGAGDSFLPFLYPYFDLIATKKIRTDYFWPDFFNKSVIEDERPDFVVLEVTERYLDRLLFEVY